MEGAFRSFVGEVLRIKRGVVAAPAAAACDIVQQRILDHFRAVNEQIERRLAAHDARIYEEVKYLMIAMADEAFLIEDGSQYPALYRLERKGWVDAEWGTSELGRRAKLYRLTPAGRQRLAAEVATWKRFAADVAKVFAT